ncbi:hypothetical protein BAUCODRAFT_72505, partial [Baudoinia panamericana UAMH 10762]
MRFMAEQYPASNVLPDTSPISEEQLTSEIKGLYTALVMLEEKCTNIDAAQVADPSANSDASQWQALVALHRTLLYEHHDFLMATQHPSATPALRALPTRYAMPARMWKHAIHALAYQTVAQLYDRIPVFLDTRIECIADLTRYRIAVEEGRDAHAQWGSVAASWYIKASDLQVGRLHHHLSIM